MTREFKVGKLYQITNKSWNSTYVKSGAEPRLEIKTPGFAKQYKTFSLDDTILILELLYINHTKMARVSEASMTVFNQWHAKILVNDIVGFVSIWEDDWSELR